MIYRLKDRALQRKLDALSDDLQYNHDDVFPTFIEWISDSNKDPVPLRPVFGVIGFAPVEDTKQ